MSQVFIVTDEDGVQGVYTDPVLAILHARAAWPDSHMMLYGPGGGGSLAPEHDSGISSCLMEGGLVCVADEEVGAIAWIEPHPVRTAIPVFIHEQKGQDDEI